MINYENLEHAYKTLKTCYDDYLQAQDSIYIEYITDSCIKRFEYTLEMAWKLAKKIFIHRYGKTETELTMNNIFRYMQGYGYTKNWENWQNYYQLRNNTAHEYNFEKSRKLIEIVPSFINDVEFFIEKLKGEKNLD